MNLGVRIGLSVMVTLLPASTQATDGYFDTTWTGSGRITFAGDVANPSRSFSASGVITESSGNLLVWGNTSDSGVLHDSWFAELFPNGQFAPTFGANDDSGRITFSHLFSNIGIASNAVAIQPDGKFLILTISDPPYLFRTTAQMHALEGNVPTQIAINNFQTITGNNAVALTADGNVLVAGVGQYAGGGTNRFGVVRLNSDLSLDTSFNATAGGGAVVPIVANDDSEEVTDILVQPDGRIVLIGFGMSAGVIVLEAARLTAGGALDNTFGNNGVISLPWPAGTVSSIGIGTARLDRAGRILVPMHGTYDAGLFSITGMLVARLKSSGFPDTDFAGTGFSFRAPDPAQCDSSEANAVSLDSAGRILVTGECFFSGASTYFAVERLRGDNGTLDASFGVSGYSFGAYVATDGYYYGHAVTFDGSGHPVLAGDSYFFEPGFPVLAGVARLTYDLIYTNTFETAPSGCLPPDCN
jgi:uncharacterized delta-60 repeat protein